MLMKDISVEARSLSSGYQIFNVSAGQNFKIETSPKGESILDWKTEIYIYFKFYDYYE